MTVHSEVQNDDVRLMSLSTAKQQQNFLHDVIALRCGACTLYALDCSLLLSYMHTQH